MAPEIQTTDTQAIQDSGQPEEEAEEDDLNALDVPDLPPSTKLYGRRFLCSWFRRVLMLHRRGCSETCK